MIDPAPNLYNKVTTVERREEADFWFSDFRAKWLKTTGYVRSIAP